MVLNKFNALLFIGAIAFFSGCSAKGAKFTAFQAPKEGNAMIYVYRPSAFLGKGVYYDAYANYGSGDELIGTISNGAYANKEVPANKEVEIWAKTEAKNSTALKTENKQTYCIRAGLGMGFFVGHPKFEQVDFATCQKEIVETSLDK